LPIKRRLIYFVLEDVSKEEYFSRPVKNKLLYLVDYMRYVKIVRPQPGELEKRVRVRARANTLILFLTHCVRRAHPDESGFGSQNSLSLSAAVWEPEGPLITGPITLLNMPVFILIAVSF
jgi:hypothetical protein